MRTLLIALAGLSLASPAVAQVTPYGLPYPGAITTGDIHRYEIDRLRAGADQREALARQQALSSRLTVLELQAARQTTPMQIDVYRPLRSVESERQDREIQTRRTETITQGVAQIDDWLDRRSRQAPQ